MSCRNIRGRAARCLQQQSLSHNLWHHRLHRRHHRLHRRHHRLHHLRRQSPMFTSCPRSSSSRLFVASARHQWTSCERNSQARVLVVGSARLVTPRPLSSIACSALGHRSLLRVCRRSGSRTSGSLSKANPEVPLLRTLSSIRWFANGWSKSRPLQAASTCPCQCMRSEVSTHLASLISATTHRSIQSWALVTE